MSLVFFLPWVVPERVILVTEQLNRALTILCGILEPVIPIWDSQGFLLSARKRSVSKSYRFAIHS
jgi:hypothetical protein